MKLVFNFSIFIIAVWNYDSYIIKTVAQNAFNSMIAVAGKLWCAYANTITILNPSNLNVEVNISYCLWCLA